MRGPEVRLLLAHHGHASLNPRLTIYLIRPPRLTLRSSFKLPTTCGLIGHTQRALASTSTTTSIGSRTPSSPASSSSADLTSSTRTSSFQDLQSQHDEKHPTTANSSYPLIFLTKKFVPTHPIFWSDGLESTLPAKLTTPEPLRKEDFPNQQIPFGNQAKYYFELGKSYAGFYKTGLVNVWRNYKELQTIRQRVGRTRGLEDVVKYGLPQGAKSVPVLTRTDYQLALRTQHDLGKLIPFGIIFIICGEFTPMVIVGIGSAVVPYTCRIPKQEEKDLFRPVRIQDRYRTLLDNLKSQGAAAQKWQFEFLEAWWLRLNPFSKPFPVLGYLWHRFISGPRLRKHCEQVLCDTILIVREGGFDKLSPREVFLWSLKQGLPILTHYVERLRLQGDTVDPDSPKLKRILLPSVEAEAERILRVDWRQVRPEDHWLAVFSPGLLPQVKHGVFWGLKNKPEI
ncbi:uncharacterized protein Z518_00319 [Rhinocladiella mackenziei CBS 650.93]|uniref:Rhinocladiella mackenziei CBS 650.93 unplaced genomic scaffold supercont1.1, whole genome shotgun sequence n=1 Tax=Rhinocladiella mackenziei CBS 650.93 TaxID=1442369 RepID=A0A0D2JII3_9EURO|nr:uncharacterized protein Z518_00319 [Rhinocladiella mackenziei CBS 650.93]KIX09240.1 hypothetical protein Z518_00319 [Rhinocladiella mackenziei CBS 650.93]